MSVVITIKVNDNSDDVDDFALAPISTIEGECPSCVKPRGVNTLVATKIKYLTRSTMKIWMSCMICHEEHTLKCKIEK